MNPIKIGIDKELYDRLKDEQEKFSKKTGLKISIRKLTKQLAKSNFNIHYPELNIFRKRNAKKNK